MTNIEEAVEIASFLAMINRIRGTDCVVPRNDKNMKKIIIIALVAIGFTTVRAQEDVKEVSPITLSGYVETYYSYDFGNPDNHARPGFVYSYNRHNEVNLNLGFAKVNYAKGNVRANLALMAGILQANF